MNLEILIFHFENKNCFDVSLKQYVFEILQLFGFFLEKRLFVLVFGDIVFSESMSWGDLLFLMGFQANNSRKSSRLCLRNICLFLNTHFISMNNNE